MATQYGYQLGVLLLEKGWTWAPQEYQLCEECGGEPVCEMCNGTNSVEHHSPSGGVMNCPNGYDDRHYVGCRPKCQTCKGTGRLGMVYGDQHLIDPVTGEQHSPYEATRIQAERDGTIPDYKPD